MCKKVISCALDFTRTRLPRYTPGAVLPRAGPVWNLMSLWETARWGQPQPLFELQRKQSLVLVTKPVCQEL